MTPPRRGKEISQNSGNRKFLPAETGKMFVDWRILARFCQGRKEKRKFQNSAEQRLLPLIAASLLLGLAGNEQQKRQQRIGHRRPVQAPAK
jgi:hypothetical protein